MLKQGQRILAAIMFTDMEGYTALTQVDEKKSKVFRDRHRMVLEEATKKHNGKNLQYWGDGTLTIFDSAVEAVHCAVDIQKELQKEPKIPLRIGIHIGDIVYDDEGIYGDGVNLASRLESLSISGGVLISYKVNDELKNKKDFSTKPMGQYELKNVKQPMEVFALTNEGLVIPRPEDLKKKSRRKNRINALWISGIVVFALVVLFLAFKFVGLFDSDNKKKDNNLLLQTLTPVEEVKAFINDIGSSDLKSAYGRQKNEVWHDYNMFCSNAFYGEIDSVHINNYSLKTSDSLEALVYAEYSLYSKDDRSGKYEKNFTLQKFDTCWKIAGTEDISFKAFGVQKESQKTGDMKTKKDKTVNGDDIRKQKIKQNIIKKTKIRRNLIKKRLNK